MAFPVFKLKDDKLMTVIFPCHLSIVRLPEMCGSSFSFVSTKEGNWILIEVSPPVIV